MAVEMVRVRHPETGAEAELPVTAVDRPEYADWKRADKPAAQSRRASGANPTQEG